MESVEQLAVELVHGQIGRIERKTQLSVETARPAMDRRLGGRGGLGDMGA